MLLLVALVLIVLLTCVLLKRRFEVVMPTLTGVMLLLCYFLSMFKLLALFQWIICGLVIGLLCALVVLGATKKIEVSSRAWFMYAITPGTVAFALLALVFACVLSNHVVTATDDINYWAVEVKSIYAQNGLVDSYLHLSPRFMDYTPGMQLFQWIGLKIAGGFSEGVMFVMLAVFYSIFLLPFAVKLTWKKSYYIPLYMVFAIAAPTIVFRDAYTMLRVDAALGVCLGCALCQAWLLSMNSKPSWFDFFALTMTLTTLVFVKQIGAAWAMFPFLLFIIFKQKRTHSAVKIGVLLGSILIVLASWYLFTNIRQLSGIHENNFQNIVANISASDWQEPEHLKQLPNALWGAFTYGDKTALINSPTTSIVYPSLLLWLALIILIPLLLAIVKPCEHSKALKKLSLWWICCGILVVIGFVLLFLTAFAPEFDRIIGNQPARLQYLLERYLGALLMGGILLCVCLINQIDMPKPLKGMLAACGLLLFSNWGQLSLNLIPSQYTVEVPNDFLINQEENYWISDLEFLDDPLDAIILYGVNPTPYRPERLQYALAPYKIVTFYNEINESDFIGLLKRRHITHVLCMDDSNPTYLAASEFVEDGYMDTFILYEVLWEDDVPLLVCK